MNFELPTPSTELLADFDTLQVSVTEDTTGEKTRRLVEYFTQAENLSMEMRLRSTDFEEKNFAGLVGDAFGASRRIVLSAWQKAHGSELSV